MNTTRGTTDEDVVMGNGKRRTIEIRSVWDEENQKVPTAKEKQNSRDLYDSRIKVLN